MSDAGLFEVAIFLADSPADIETREIADGKRPHGHAEIVERGIDGFDAGAFFQKKLRLRDVRMKHAVADKSATVPYQDADLAEFFRELHAGGDDFLAGGFAADNFEEPHHVCGTEEMRANDCLGTRGRGSNLIDVQRGGVAGQNGVRVCRRGRVRRRLAFFSAMPSNTASMTMSAFAKES